MKKLIAVVLGITVLVSFSACGSDKPGKIGNVHFDNAQEAYEAMTDAIENGDYAAAVEYYNSGAAQADGTDVVSQYYYAVAMNDRESKGCLGYPIYLIDRCSDLFTDANEAFGEFQLMTRKFDGAYQCNDYYYLYFADGKIAIGDSAQLTGHIYCNGELVCKDDTYYWAEHNPEGDDKLLYELELTESGMNLVAVDENEGLYAGEYITFSAEMPALIY